MRVYLTKFALHNSSNRLQLTGPLATTTLPRLTHIRLNSTLITWAEVAFDWLQ